MDSKVSRVRAFPHSLLSTSRKIIDSIWGLRCMHHHGGGAVSRKLKHWHMLNLLSSCVLKRQACRNITVVTSTSTFIFCHCGSNHSFCCTVLHPQDSELYTLAEESDLQHLSQHRMYAMQAHVCFVANTANKRTVGMQAPEALEWPHSGKNDLIGREDHIECRGNTRCESREAARNV